MGLSSSELKRKMSIGNKDAEKIYKIRKKGNLLLTTLLIGNVAVNSALSILLGSITSGFTAGLIATSLIVVLGEITPQAIFSRFALSLGAKMIWFVKISIFVFYPISFPIAWVLNKVLGEEMATIYSKKELMKIIEEHGGAKESDIDLDEEKIVKGALSFSDKQVKDVMTPRTVVNALEVSQVINDNLLKKLRESSHSRFPVYKEEIDNVVGILYLRQLLGKGVIGKTIGEVADKKVLFIEETKNLDDAFGAFLKTHHHLFVVHDEFNAVSGLITLEDVLEEIIRDEIMDEVDVYDDLRKLARKKNKKRNEVV